MPTDDEALRAAQRMPCNCGERAHLESELEKSRALVAKLDASAERFLDERDEARKALESIPEWGGYNWNEVVKTVRLKLKENASQIVFLMHERDEAVELARGAVALGAERTRERAEHATE